MGFCHDSLACAELPSLRSQSTQPSNAQAKHSHHRFDAELPLMPDTRFMEHSPECPGCS